MCCASCPQPALEKLLAASNMFWLAAGNKCSLCWCFAGWPKPALGQLLAAAPSFEACLKCTVFNGMLSTRCHHIFDEWFHNISAGRPKPDPTATCSLEACLKGLFVHAACFSNDHPWLGKHGVMGCATLSLHIEGCLQHLGSL